MNSTSVKALKDYYSFCAVGACGGNQVFEIEKSKSFLTFYINSAVEDLRSLGDNIHSFHIPESVGCHKDRLVSQQFLIKNYPTMLENVKRYLDTEYVFVVGSTDGGTSSGQIPYLTSFIEEELGKKAIPIVTIPNMKTASLRQKKNTYDCLVEIFNMAKHAVFIVDNNKIPDYDKSNMILANNMHAFLSDISLSKESIFDRSEINDMLDVQGYAFINKFSRKATQIDITQEIYKAIDSGNHLAMETENTMYYLGIKTSNTMKTIDINYDDIKLKYGIYDVKNTGYSCKNNIIAMSGLEKPTSFLTTLDEDITKEEIKIKTELEKKESRNIILKPRTSVLDQLKENVRKEEPKEMSARDRLMASLGKK